MGLISWIKNKISPKKPSSPSQTPTRSIDMAGAVDLGAKSVTTTYNPSTKQYESRGREPTQAEINSVTRHHFSGKGSTFGGLNNSSFSSNPATPASPNTQPMKYLKPNTDSSFKPSNQLSFSVPKNQWNKNGFYSSGTSTYTPPEIRQKTDVGFGSKVSDAFGAVTLMGGFGAGVDIPSGETGKAMLQEYKERRAKIGKEMLSLTYPKAVGDMYNLNQEFRARSNKIKDEIANIQYNDLNPNTSFSVTTKNLINAGVSPKDIKLTSNNSSRNFNVNLDFKTIKVSSVAKKVSEGNKLGAYFEKGLYDVNSIGWMYVGGSALKGAGILGGASTEGGKIGQALTTVSTMFPKLGSVLEFGSKKWTQRAIIGGVGVLGGYEGYKFGKETGLNPIATAIMGFGKNVGSYFTFTAGATGGEISPLKTLRVNAVDTSGKNVPIKIYSIGDPTSGKYTAISSNIGGNKYWGYAPTYAYKGLNIPVSVENQIAIGTPEGESWKAFYGKGKPEYESVIKSVDALRWNSKVLGEPQIDLTNQKGFASLTKAQQAQWTKEMQTLGDVGNANTAGFRRFTGGITGYYNRPTQDVDTILGTTANPKLIGSDIANRMGGGISSKGIQIYSPTGKLWEGLTPENAIPQPLGRYGLYSASASIKGVEGFPATGTAVTKAGQSLTELGSAITFPNFATSGEMTFGANLDKPQRVVDFFTTGSKLGSSSALGVFKESYSKIFPNLNWNGGNVVSTAGFGSASTSALSSSSVSSIAMAGTSISVFMPKSASSTSANIRAFIPSKASSISSFSSSESAFSFPSSLSSSVSSSSSSSSGHKSRSSSSSSWSPSSSSSSSSISSLSSISSISSLSSSSSSSSSSSIVAPVIPPFVPPFSLGANMFDIGGKNFKINRKYTYTPSFKALMFNIRGKAPKTKTFTGFEVRPITKGFSWAKTFGKSISIKSSRRKKR